MTWALSRLRHICSSSSRLAKRYGSIRGEATSQSTVITITRPDDWHVHLRDGAALATTVPHTATQFARAIVMPNLQPPITTVKQAEAYRERILAAVPMHIQFQPLMTLYLTDSTTPDEILLAKQAGIVAVKLYPAGATTNSSQGVTDIRNVYRVFEAMQQVGMLLLLHGEVTSPAIDIFDREAVFIEKHLIPLRNTFPNLKIVLEHITTREAVEYVRDSENPNIGATITAHHLLYNRNAIFLGGVRPHYYCLPVLKRETHRQALVKAATSGSPRFFLGSDSAPHAAGLKECAVGCAGCYTAPAALEMYTEVFESVGALEQLEAFASFNGADFYGLPRNTARTRLSKEPWTVPSHFQFGTTIVKPLRAGEQLTWRAAPLSP